MYNKMQDHWKYNGPPVYIAVAHYLGMVQKRPRKTTEGRASMTGSWDQLVAQFSGTGGVIQ